MTTRRGPRSADEPRCPAADAAAPACSRPAPAQTEREVHDRRRGMPISCPPLEAFTEHEDAVVVVARGRLTTARRYSPLPYRASAYSSRDSACEPRPGGINSAQSATTLASSMPSTHDRVMTTYPPAAGRSAAIALLLHIKKLPSSSAESHTSCWSRFCTWFCPGGRQRNTPPEVTEGQAPCDRLATAAL